MSAMAPPGPLPRPWGPGRRAAFAVLLGLGLGQAAVAVAAALGMRWLFDSLAGGQPVSAAGVLAVGVALALAQGGLGHAAARTGEALGQDYAAAVRSALLQHLFRLPPARHQALRHGHLMARMTGDLGALRRWIGRALAPLLVGGATLLATLALLLAWAPGVAAVLLPALAVGAVLAWGVGRRLERHLRAERRERWALAGQVGERLAAAAVVQTAAQPARELQRLHRRQQRLRAAAVRRAGSAALLRLLGPVAATLALGAVAAWGALQIAAGAWSVGTLAGVLTALGLTWTPVRRLATGLAAWHDWRVSCEKLEGFLALPAGDANPRAAAWAGPPAGHLVAQALAVEAAGAVSDPDPDEHGEAAGQGGDAADARNVDGAAAADEPAAAAPAPAGGTGRLAAIDIDLPARGTLAVTGRSGSGKSLLLRTIAGWVPLHAGRIGLDGVDLAHCPPAQRARHVALVSADLPLLRGSVGANLRYTRRGADAATQWAALRQVGIDDDGLALPRGLATRVDEGGRNLPRVLRQRLCLARALVGQPAVLLIDDFDLLLDADDLRNEALRRLLAEPPATTVIVTREGRWQRRCAQRLHLAGGRPALAVLAGGAGAGGAGGAGEGAAGRQRGGHD